MRFMPQLARFPVYPPVLAALNITLLVSTIERQDQHVGVGRYASHNRHLLLELRSLRPNRNR
jgi:hypothetical protein